MNVFDQLGARHRDFSHREDMYRNPQGLNENLKRLKEIIDSNF